MSILTILAFVIHKARETSAYRYHQFQQGQEAYKSANCQKAVLFFIKLERTASFPFNSFDRLTDLAQNKVTICESYTAAKQHAKQAEQRKEFSNALINRFRFIDNHKRDELTQSMRNAIFEMFSTYGIAKLAGRESCDDLEKLQNNMVIPNVSKNLPLFYHSCARFYDQNHKPEQALVQLRRFLAFSPQHPLSKGVQRAVVTNQYICPQVANFQSIPNIEKLPALMPVIYLNCSNANYNAMAYPEAKNFLHALRKNYPNHSLAKEANNRLFAINQEIELVKSEMHRSVETITKKIEGCLAIGMFGFGWVIDIWEFFTGRNCGLEEPLNTWERFANIIPWFGEFKQIGKVAKMYNLAKISIQKRDIKKIKSLSLDDQSLYKLLKDKETLILLMRHNPRLSKLVYIRLNQRADNSKKPLFLEHLR